MEDLISQIVGYFCAGMTLFWVWMAEDSRKKLGYVHHPCVPVLCILMMLFATWVFL